MYGWRRVAHSLRTKAIQTLNQRIALGETAKPSNRRLRIDLWCHLTLQSNGEDIARIIARKPVRFRRTAVPSPRCDLDGAVPIAKREVVKLRRLGSIVGDLVGSPRR